MSASKELSYDRSVDYYALLGITSSDCTDKDVIKAYRKKALECHPDKRPDDPQANETFLQISKALEVLTNPKAKAELDRSRKAQLASAERNAKLNDKRKKLKEDLLFREAKGDQPVVIDKKTQANRLAAEIERLRREGSELLRHEMEEVEREIKLERTRDSQAKRTLVQGTVESAKLRLRWKSAKDDPANGGYSQELLQEVLSKYGVISALAMSKKRGTALVEFQNNWDAVKAANSEKGLEGNPLEYVWISGRPTNPQESKAQSEPMSFMNPFVKGSSSGLVTDSDFEDIVLMKMRQQSERKRLLAQMEENERKKSTADDDCQVID